MSCGAHSVARSPLVVFDADRAAVLDHDPERKRVHFDPEILLPQCRMQISPCGAVALAVADGPLCPAKPVLLRAVVILGKGMAGFHAGLNIRLVKRVHVFGAPHVDRSRAAAIWRLTAFPGFSALE